MDLLKRNEPLIERLAGEGLLRLEDAALRPTLAGLAVTDSLARTFELGEPEATSASPRSPSS